jgi:hypothetical protein
VTCSKCHIEGKTTATGRLPRGWKRRDNSAFCKVCWQSAYILRAITIPVAEPLDGTWEDLRIALRAAWAATTQASNWMMTQLYTRDVRRLDQLKMPPMPRVYLYPEARGLFPTLPSQSIAALEQAIQRKYRAMRYQIIWTATSALPSHRYPVPLPIHNQSWAAFIDNNRPVVSVRMSDRRFRLRLKGGPQFHRQRAAFDQMVSGDAVRGELALYQQRGGPLACKMVAWLPREPKSTDAQRCTGTLIVRTESQHFLVAVNEKNETLWVYNGDHLKRWAKEHRRRLQRWAEDSKYEQRPVPAFSERREAAVQKYRNRMLSACHEIAAMIAGYAARGRFGTVRIDDRDRSYCPDFPWLRCRALISEKCDAAGCTCEFLGGDEVPAARVR